MKSPSKSPTFIIGIVLEVLGIIFIFIGQTRGIGALLLIVGGVCMLLPVVRSVSELNTDSVPKKVPAKTPDEALHSMFSHLRTTSPSKTNSERSETRGRDASQSSKEQAIAYCNEGKRLYEQQREREALRAFNEALKYDAFLFDAVIGKMVSHLMLEEDGQALETAGRVLSLNPNSRMAWLCIATTSWKRRYYKMAWEGVNRLLSYDPKDGRALFIKAALLEDAGRISEAAEVLNQAAEYDPHNELAAEGRDVLRQRIHEERVEKTVDWMKFFGGMAADVGKIIAQDVFLPNCLKCGAQLAPGENICHVCGRPR